MKKILPLIFLNLLLTITAFGNDGAFYASGNTLVPLKETKITLKKEVLKFYIHDFNWMRVDVDFTFYNPGPSKKLTVGFVTPPADGDVTEKELSHPQIKDFTVVVNGTRLAYKIKRMRETSFKLTKIESGGDDFVYYFPVTFKKGLNRLRHTYLFRGGGSVDLQRDFDYVITTGKSWANGQIDDFELQLHLDNGIYSIPAGFWKSERRVNWQIVGNGVIAEKSEQWFGVENSPLMRIAHLNSGYILFREKNFKPDQEISLGEYQWGAGWFSKWCKESAKCPDSEEAQKLTPYFTVDPEFDLTSEYTHDLSENDIKIIGNFAYAIRGLPFKDKLLNGFYSKFIWYKPNPAVTAASMRLSSAEKRFLTILKEWQREKK